MKISGHIPAHLAARRPATAAVREQDSLLTGDQVDLSGTSSLRSRLEAGGFLKNFSALPTPFGSVLDAATRQALEATLSEMQAEGVRFSIERERRLPFTSKEKELPGGELLDAIEEQLKEGKRPSVRMDTPWQSSASVRHFGEVLAVKELADDGGGELLEAARSLQSTGLVHEPERLFCDVRSGDGAYLMLEKGSQWDHPEPDRVGSDEDVFFLDYMLGSGKDRGLSEPGVAAGLKKLYEAGQMSRAYAFRVYSEGQEHAQLGNGRQLSLLVAREHLNDFERIQSTYEKFAQACRTHLAPAVAKAAARGRGGPHGGVPDQVRRTDAGFTPEVRVQAYAGVLDAAASLELPQHKIYSAAYEVYSKLVAGAENEAQLFTRLKAVTPTLASEGGEAALELLDDLSAAKVKTSPKEQIFSDLLAQTESLELARAGVNLVRIPLEGESLEDRVGLFTEIAANLPQNSRSLSGEFYQEVLINRQPSLPLKENGRRFVAILKACANLDQPGMAPAVYEVLQNRALEGTDPEVSINNFLEAAVTGKSVAQALHAMADSVEEGSIEFLEDEIQIGDFSLQL